MKASELRVGNIIYQSPLYNKEMTVIGIITSRFKDQNAGIILQHYPRPAADGLVNPETIEGIPLSPEWLQRAGFEGETSARRELKLPHNGFYSVILVLGVGAGGFYISIVNPHKHNNLKENYQQYHYECSIGREPIKYVHQLQNLFFALTGTELEFKEYAANQD